MADEKSIVVTDEMINAGVRAIDEGKHYGMPDGLDRWGMVEQIYMAMHSVSPSASPAASDKADSAKTLT